MCRSVTCGRAQLTKRNRVVQNVVTIRHVCENAHASLTNEAAAEPRRPRVEKVLVFVLFLLLLAAAASFVYRDEISMLVAFNKLKPAAPFSNASSPGSPDHSLPAN